jgi:hypothetical protein
MHCFELQSWVFLRTSPTQTQTISQSENAWLDLSAFRDVTLWVEIERATLGSGGTAYLNFQTNASKEEDLFQNIVQLNFASGLLGVTVAPVHLDIATTPLARWLRWQFTTTNQSTRSEITFRAWAAAGGAGAGMRGGRA